MYHVELGGQGFLIDPRSYRRRAHAPFVPKTARGDRTYGDLSQDQVLRVSAWSGGEGFLQLDPERPDRWRSGTGTDGYTEPGSLRLGPHLLASAPTAVSELTVAHVFDGKLFVGTSAGAIYRWDGATWTLELSTGKAGGIRSMAVFLGRLYVGNGSDGVVASRTIGGVWTAAAFTIASAAAGVRALAAFYRQSAQYLYAVASQPAADSAAATAGVYWWDGSTLSGRQYDFEEPRCSATAVLGSRLYFFAAHPASGRGSIYSVDDSGGGGIYRAHVPFDEGYPTAATTWDGAVYVGMGSGGQVYRWDGASLELAHQLGTPARPYVGGELRGLATWGGALWVAYADGSGANAVGLLRHDEAGWSRPASGLSGTEPRALVVYNGQLHVLTAAAANAQMHRTVGTYRASGQLETGLFDAGLPSVDKVLRSVTLTHGPLAARQSIEVQYRLEDDGAWVTLGTSGTVGATTATFAFAGTVTCKQVALRIVLAGSAGASSSPVLYDWLLRYAPAPELKREWELAVRLEGTPQLPLVRLDGTPEPLTGAQLSQVLWTLKGQAGPTTLVDLDGATRWIWIAELREEMAELASRLGTQTIGKLRLVEA